MTAMTATGAPGAGLAGVLRMTRVQDWLAPVLEHSDAAVLPLHLDRACPAPTGRVPPLTGTAVIGVVVHLLATAIEEGRDLSAMSGILAGTVCRLLLA
jgi:hypothetical protein